jgi:hypothetical protein
MKHLDADRLLELGLEPEQQPSADEANHLAECETCAHELELEHQLTADLVELPQPSVPVSFAAATTIRFEQAVAKRHVRRTAWGMAISLALGNVAALALVGIVVLNGQAVAQGVAGFVQEVVVLGHAFAVVATKVPIIPVMLAGAVCATVLVLSTGLGRLAMVGVEAK